MTEEKLARASHLVHPHFPRNWLKLCAQKLCTHKLCRQKPLKTACRNTGAQHKLKTWAEIKNYSPPEPNILNHHGPRTIWDVHDPSGGEVALVVILPAAGGILHLRIHPQRMNLHLGFLSFLSLHVLQTPTITNFLDSLFKTPSKKEVGF